MRGPGPWPDARGSHQHGLSVRDREQVEAPVVQPPEQGAPAVLAARLRRHRNAGDRPDAGAGAEPVAPGVAGQPPCDLALPATDAGGTNSAPSHLGPADQRSRSGHAPSQAAGSNRPAGEFEAARSFPGRAGPDLATADGAQRPARQPSRQGLRQNSGPCSATRHSRRAGAAPTRNPPGGRHPEGLGVKRGLAGAVNAAGIQRRRRRCWALRLYFSVGVS